MLGSDSVGHALTYCCGRNGSKWLSVILQLYSFRPVSPRFGSGALPAKAKAAPKENGAERLPPEAANDSFPDPEAKFWLNTSSNVGHNASYRYFGAIKLGRYCRQDEAKACDI